MIDHLDHLVLTTAKEAECVDFYTRVLGMRLESFIGGTPPVERKAFKFGNQKINLHIKGKEFQTFIPKKGKNGIDTVTSKCIREYAVEILPSLTPAEIQEIAKLQAMKSNQD